MYFFQKKRNGRVYQENKNEKEETSLEVCMSVANIIDEAVIEGTRKVSWPWRVYI